MNYIVQPGDTLYGIATRFGTTIEMIMRANRLQSPMLYVGQQLFIPTAHPHQGPGPMPGPTPGQTPGPMPLPTPVPGTPQGIPPSIERRFEHLERQMNRLENQMRRIAARVQRIEQHLNLREDEE